MKVIGSKIVQSLVTIPSTTVPSLTPVDDEYLSYIYDINQVKTDLTNPHLGGLILEIAGLKEPSELPQVCF